MEKELDLFEYQIWEYEQQRTERICDEFYDVESSEAYKKSRLPKKQKKYIRTLSGYGKVTKIDPDTIVWTRRNGEEIAPVLLNENICRDLCIGDEIHFNLGFRHGLWRVIAFSSIINGVGETYNMYVDPEIEIEEPKPEPERIFNLDDFH